MASIYRRRRLQPIPEGAKLVIVRGVRSARWTTKRGQIKTAKLNEAGDRIVVEGSRYTISIIDHQGRRRCVVGTADLASTKRIAAKLEAKEAEYEHGSRDARGERLGSSAKRPVAEHLQNFAESMEGRGVTDQHIADTLSYIRVTIQACGFTSLADIDAAKIEGHKGDLLREGRSRSNINHRLTAFKSFTKWLHHHDRIGFDPMPRITKLNEKVDRRHVRRAFSVDEFTRLANAAVAGPVVRGMAGSDRAMCYRLAVETGLRASELGSLTPRSFDLAKLEAATVTVKAGYSKHRREDVLPLRRAMAEAVAGFIEGKAPLAPLFNVPDKPAAMLRVDLEAAGIAYRDDEDRVADFHALRHTTGSWLAAQGVHPKVIQQIMRHSTITLTMDRYTHMHVSDERAALDRLPDIGPQDDTEAMRATGTDDTREKAHTRVSTSVSRRGVPASHGVSLAVTGQRADDGASVDEGQRANPLKIRGFDALSHGMSQGDTGENGNGPCWIRTSDHQIMSPAL